MVTDLAPEPEPKQKRKYTKRTAKTSSTGTDELVRLAILTAINTITATTFNLVAIVAKDGKWKLHQDECAQLSNDIDAALALLPEKQYELIINYLATLSPFAALGVTLSGIIKARLDTPKTTNANSTKSAESNPIPSAEQSSNFDNAWRFNPGFTINGIGN